MPNDLTQRLINSGLLPHDYDLPVKQHKSPPTNKTRGKRRTAKMHRRINSR